MNPKRILIVDDEESILTILKNSLKKMGPDYHIVTVTDGFMAIDQLFKYHFDVVVTDYNMAHMDGLELMEAIGYAQPKAKTIMITAYHDNVLEKELTRLNAFRLLTKPLKITTFRQVVQEALEQSNHGQKDNLYLPDTPRQKAKLLLGHLQLKINAHCIFLTDPNGRMVVQTGQLPLEGIISLPDRCQTAAFKAKQTLHNEVNAIKQLYYEDTTAYLYNIDIGHYLHMTIIINCGGYSNKLGAVWDHAQRTAMTLRQIFTQSDILNLQIISDRG